MSTAYHAKYFAHALLRSSTEDGVEKISRSLFDAAVDLNPHQIDVALFALKSPLSKGVVLAIELKIRELGRKQREQRQRIFDVEDEIAGKRDALIDALRKRLEQETEHDTLFMIRWRVI